MRANPEKSSAQAPVPYSWRHSDGLIDKSSLLEAGTYSSPRTSGSHRRDHYAESERMFIAPGLPGA